MFRFEVNTPTVNVSRKRIEAMLTTNPDVRKALQDLIRDELARARGRLANDIKNALPGSEHESWRAVRRQVYNSILGGDLNIMNMKKGTAGWKIRQKTRKVEANPHMRGGNRRRRSHRTIQIDSYEGKARGFILRFVNSGTKQRFIGGRNTYKSNIEYLNRIEKGTGNRGRIAPRNFFEGNAQRELIAASKVIGSMIDAEIQKVMNKNNTI
jgi:hypothetical protein